MSKRITESNMSFISENTFQIEKSLNYASLGGNVKSVEFVRSMENRLLFIEAKSSFPNPDNPASTSSKDGKTGRDLFNEEISEIYEKFVHSLNLYAAIDVGIDSIAGNGFPPGYTPPENVSLHFVLVIKDFEKSWCVSIENALGQRIRKSVCLSKIWKPEISVINEGAAASRSLIAAEK